MLSFSGTSVERISAAWIFGSEHDGTL